MAQDAKGGWLGEQDALRGGEACHPARVLGLGKKHLKASGSP